MFAGGQGTVYPSSAGELQNPYGYPQDPLLLSQHHQGQQQLSHYPLMSHRSAPQSVLSQLAEAEAQGQGRDPYRPDAGAGWGLGGLNSQTYSIGERILS